MLRCSSKEDVEPLDDNEHEPITRGTQKPHAKMDGAAPCYLLSILLVTVTIIGAGVVGLLIAAFNPSRGQNTAQDGATVSKSSSGPNAAGASDAVVSMGTQVGMTEPVPRLVSPPSPARSSTAAFSAKTEVDGELWRVAAVLGADDANITWENAIALLSDSGSGGASFRHFLTSTLRSSPHNAFFWETPPLSLATMGSTTFGFITLPAPHLSSVEPDTSSFSAQLGSCAGMPVARSFRNLGGDALLVSPCAATGVALSSYTHLAAFIRSAPAAQIDALWLTLGQALGSELSTRGASPSWVSTEGSGVSWLHIRIDSKPKYFHHKPFRYPPVRHH